MVAAIAAQPLTTESIKKISGALQNGREFLELLNQFDEPANDKTIEE